MPATRTVTYGFGAWVGLQKGVTSCGWWPQDPTTLKPPFDPNKLIDSDLSKNLQAVRNGTIKVDAIEVDDPPPFGGETKIGATFPNGILIGGCWIPQEIYDALPKDKKPPRVPADMRCREYELTSVYYWDGNLANRRFWGFYAEIHAETLTSALCSIWPAGTSQVPGQLAAGSWWLDLTTQAHPIEKGFTEIGTGANPKQGALFLDASTRISIAPQGVKLPRWATSNVMPRSR